MLASEDLSVDQKRPSPVIVSCSTARGAFLLRLRERHAPAVSARMNSALESGCKARSGCKVRSKAGRPPAWACRSALAIQSARLRRQAPGLSCALCSKAPKPGIYSRAFYVIRSSSTAQSALLTGRNSADRHSERSEESRCASTEMLQSQGPKCGPTAPSA